MCYSQLLIIVILVIVLYAVFAPYSNSSQSVEGFTNQSNTIISDKLPYTQNQVAANEVLASEIHSPDPSVSAWNDINSRISHAQAKNQNKNFDNTYYMLWQSDLERQKNSIYGMANQIHDSKLNCVDFNNINQCMSVCSNTDTCSGFYVDSPGKCCMLVNPPYVDYRTRHNVPVDNTSEYAFRTLNNMVKQANLTDGKMIFNRTGSDGFNDRYVSNLSRNVCRTFCPKCIMGRCPKDYRCTNLMADPRYNHTCIITNEGRYDENLGNTFDNVTVPYLDDKHQLNEYAGYNNSIRRLSMKNPSYKFNLEEGIVSTIDEIASRSNNSNNIVEHFDPYLNGDLGRNGCTTISYQVNPTRGDCFDPKLASESAHIVAVHGENDLTNINGYIDHHGSLLSKDKIYQKYYADA